MYLFAYLWPLIGYTLLHTLSCFLTNLITDTIWHLLETLFGPNFDLESVTQSFLVIVVVQKVNMLCSKCDICDTLKRFCPTDAPLNWSPFCTLCHHLTSFGHPFWHLFGPFWPLVDLFGKLDTPLSTTPGWTPFDPRWHLLLVTHSNLITDRIWHLLETLFGPNFDLESVTQSFWWLWLCKKWICCVQNATFVTLWRGFAPQMHR